MICSECSRPIPDGTRYFGVYLIQNDDLGREADFTGYVWHLKCAPEDVRKNVGVEGA